MCGAERIPPWPYGYVNPPPPFFLARQWTRNCRGATFCFEARPALHSADAMQALVGGDWNDDYWGEAGGFVYG